MISDVASIDSQLWTAVPVCVALVIFDGRGISREGSVPHQVDLNGIDAVCRV